MYAAVCRNFVMLNALCRRNNRGIQNVSVITLVQHLFAFFKDSYHSGTLLPGRFFIVVKVVVIDFEAVISDGWNFEQSDFRFMQSGSSGELLACNISEGT